MILIGTKVKQMINRDTHVINCFGAELAFFRIREMRSQGKTKYLKWTPKTIIRLTISRVTRYFKSENKCLSMTNRRYSRTSCSRHYRFGSINYFDDVKSKLDSPDPNTRHLSSQTITKTLSSRRNCRMQWWIKNLARSTWHLIKELEGMFLERHFL